MLVIFYLAISNENKFSYLKMATIAFQVTVSNFRLNGPIIILDAITYF
jgi:hypothetical protein